MEKLIRDKIPEIIARKGERAATRVAQEGEYREKLEEKLLEEVRELLADRNPEEMADVLEVLLALAQLYGFTMQEVETVRLQKLAERGGFQQRIILETS